MKRFILLAAMGLLLSGCAASAQSSAPAASNSAAAGGAPSASPASDLFQEGAGGGEAWWETHQQDARTQEEKTAAAFALAVLKRDIGAVADRPAGIDACFEATKRDLKQKLAIYDISSPSVREIHFVKREKDDAGTLYTFKVTGGTSTDSFRGFEGTLQIHMLSSSGLIDHLPEAAFDAKT